MCAQKAVPQNWWDKRSIGLIDLIKCDVRKKAFISSFRNAAAIKWIEFASCSLKLLQTVQKSKLSSQNLIIYDFQDPEKWFRPFAYTANILTVLSTDLGSKNKQDDME